ncbi:peptidase [Aureococcus anophagefferens]|nr:peptidase [Aureococcus anophagefferens]
MDGHNDLPWTLYQAYEHRLEKVDLREPQEAIRGDAAVQKTLEQIDVVHRLCEKYSGEMGFAWSAADVRRIVAEGKLASMCGVEGGHQINGSLATLRMTLTHNGGPGWADAALDDDSKYVEHAGAGLSPFGCEVVREMNRVGMAVDIAHVHEDTMRKAIEVSEAPVIFSHSNTRAVCNHPRNVPDDVLLSLKNGKDGVVMININAPFIAGDFFVKDGKVGATVKEVADHVDHAKKVTGSVAHIGLGADYDGIKSPSRGMEDVSTYPILTAEPQARLHRRRDVAINGGNVIASWRDRGRRRPAPEDPPRAEATPADFGEVAL